MRETAKFGTSGLRGPADALLDGTAARYCTAFCQCLLDEESVAPGAKVLIGSDLRPSSPKLLSQIASAIERAGLAPVDCGGVPTPALAFAAQLRGTAAIMVTGSHIPADRNGLKFYDTAGEISKARENEIAARVAEPGTTPLPDASQVPAIGRSAEMRETVLAEWQARNRGLIETNALAGLRIGVHEGSSVAADALSSLIEDHGGAVLRFGKNARFDPLDTEAVDPAVLEACNTRISQAGLHCVVSTDPDGDRPLVIGNDGHIVRGDLLGRITANWLGADHLSTTVNANSAIAPREGLAVLRTKIGSPFVIEAIADAIGQGFALPVGFEPNGGFLLGADCRVNGTPLAGLMTRDSFLPILAALALAARHGGDLAGALAPFGFNGAASGRLRDIDRDGALAFLEGLQDNPARREAFFAPFGRISAIDRTDGMRASMGSDNDSRIIHLRLSGNAPELRCYVEAGTDTAAALLLKECLDHLTRQL